MGGVRVSEWENPLGVVWMVPQPERRRALRWPPGSGSVNFALAPRVTAAVLAAALAGGPAFAGAAYADPAHPTINLPPTTGGEANGDDDIPDGAPAPEDQPEPAAPATPDPAPAVSDPAPAAPGPQTAAPDPPPAPTAADAAPAPADAAPLAASPQPAAPDPAPAAADPAPAAADPAPA